MRVRPCPSNHLSVLGIQDYIVVAKDGWPLELVKGRPLLNWLRRVRLGDHAECRACFEQRTGIKVGT